MDKVSQKVSPFKIFGALLLLNLMLGLVIVIFPTGIIPLGKNYSLNFVPFKKLFQKDTTKQVDAREVIANVQTVDTNLVVLDAAALAKLKKEKLDVPQEKQIQYADNTRSALVSFFKSLIELEQLSGHIRIIHYGDSQLEGDRISDYLRNRLQLRFGGWGPGIILPIDVSNSRISVRQSESKNWIKYAIYGNTPKLKNGLYGIGASSYRFSSGVGAQKDDAPKMEIIKKYVEKKVTEDDGSITTQIDSNVFYYDTLLTKIATIPTTGAWINLANATGSYPRVRQYNRLSLIYSAEEPFSIKLKVKDGQEIDEWITPGPAQVKTWNLGEVKSGVNLSFGGKSPYLFGVALDGESGITVDNFPMRGSSALGFESIQPKMLGELYRQMNVKLVILQYGINLVPDPKTNYDWYGRAFSKQLAALKAASPETSFLVIGPSDMSRKTADGFESYPNIPLIRDAMKKAAFDNGCAFWDLYTAMGGQNSMSSWVTNKLAAKDYTHFSTEGARYVSEMLYNTLMEEYQEYLKSLGGM